MPKVAMCLWFDGKAEEAAHMYTSLIPDSRIDRINRSATDNPSVAIAPYPIHAFVPALSEPNQCARSRIQRTACAT